MPSVDPTDLPKIDEHFAEKKYYDGGDAPNSNDAALYKALGEPDGEQYPNLHAWYKRVSEVEDLKNLTEATEKLEIKEEDDDDLDDEDLFGEETEEEKNAREEAKKKALERAAQKEKEGKSSILLDIKPLDTETDLEALEKKIREIDINGGISWGACKQVDIAFGLKKLQMMLTIKDALVTSDALETAIVDDLEDDVQSMDIVSWNKI
eukprot:gb/GECH01011099.1/.p1 GENE.gb/GECH01011099.1/~~gb/GECH01011099.1/.p1  ORF type:complete len:208 (+),score=72.88 gb/GECH01011099.1/:1-624(+)